MAADTVAIITLPSTRPHLMGDQPFFDKPFLLVSAGGLNNILSTVSKSFSPLRGVKQFAGVIATTLLGCFVALSPAKAATDNSAK